MFSGLPAAELPQLRLPVHDVGPSVAQPGIPVALLLSSSSVVRCRASGPIAPDEEALPQVQAPSDSSRPAFSQFRAAFVLAGERLLPGLRDRRAGVDRWLRFFGVREGLGGGGGSFLTGTVTACRSCDRRCRMAGVSLWT